MTDEQIERQIDVTKASLADKLEALESQFAGAVQTTADSFTETADAVKDTMHTVREKIRSAGEFFDLKRLAERDPWAVFGCSLAVGCAAGYCLSGRSESLPPETQSAAPPTFTAPQARTDQGIYNGVYPQAEQRPPQKHGWLKEQLESFSGLAIAALMGMLRDVAARNLPEGLGKTVSQEVDRFTTSLGAEPIAGPVAPEPEQTAANTRTRTPSRL